MAIFNPRRLLGAAPLLVLRMDSAGSGELERVNPYIRKMVTDPGGARSGSDPSRVPAYHRASMDELIALGEHGWREVGETSSGVRVYEHPLFAGQRINVSSAGGWEHMNPANENMAARGTTARQLTRYLAAIHGTASIADLTLPGRKDDE